MTAILLPALQAAREAARAAHCKSNLRQIGIALSAYSGSFGVFPISAGVAFETPSQSLGFSVHTYLLPFVGQEGMYSGINFSDRTIENWSVVSLGKVNLTAATSGVAPFLCPADSAVVGRVSGSNYRACVSIFALWYPPDDRPVSSLFRLGRCTSPAEVIDGLSRTIAFSEKLRGDGTPAVFTAYSEYFLSPFAVSYDSSLVVQACDTAPGPNPPHDSEVGARWLYATMRSTQYNHVLGPNSHIPDCTTDPSGLAGSFAARSFHAGRVFALFADGAVMPIDASIATQLWQAFGTINGGESDDAL